MSPPASPAVRLFAWALLLALVGACSQGSDGPKAPSVTALDYESHTPFPITSGAHARPDCNSCHGDFDTFTKFSCVGCHEHSQGVTDPRHSGVSGYAWDSAKCYECHPSGSVTGVDHAAFFPIHDGATHAGISCATCHVDPTNRKVVDCIGCHTAPTTDPLHSGISGYEWTNPQCLSCHPKGGIPGVDHAAWFPIHDGATHAGISCSTCHVDRSNRKVVDCVTCHTASTTDPQHGQVGGYGRTSALCLRCHGDSQVKRVSTHLPFAILSGYKHYRSSCLTCHPVARTDKPFAQDFNPFDCLSCHSKGDMDDKHQNFSTYRYVSTTCVTSGCHANGRKP
jgi:hypothetical protein